MFDYCGALHSCGGGGGTGFSCTITNNNDVVVVDPYTYATTFCGYNSFTITIPDVDIEALMCDAVEME